MKRNIIVFLFITAVCIFAGCHSGIGDESLSVTVPSSPATESENFTVATESTPPDTVPPAATDEPTIPVTESVPPATVPPIHAEDSFTPYHEKVAWDDQSIYDGPGYDYVFVRTVEVKGIYTIVEEVWDEEGNLWGRLKSGAGWIDLSDSRSEARLQMLLSANYADDRLIESGDFHHFVADTSEYAVQIAFRASDLITEVSLFSMEFTADDFEIAEEIYYIPEMGPEKPFVADLSFPGDFTTYAIRFTDSNGAVCYHLISISGRNGSLVLAEYNP